MGHKLEKKYGLLTAMCMVIGIVIGSGVFFKAETILTATGGHLLTAIAAWTVGGLIMIACAYTFSIMATKYEKVNGIVDYAEATMGKTYAYILAWFITFMYYPTVATVVAWVCARYTCVLVGIPDITGGAAMLLTGMYLCLSYGLNALSPKLAGKFQVATTIIKLIPIALMIILGIYTGIKSGVLAHNFSQAHSIEEILSVKPDYVPVEKPFLTALVSASFAFEGWIIATSINSEIKDSKRNLPIALIGGTLIISIVYVLYYVGLAGAADNLTMIAGGESGAKIAFTNILGPYGAVLLMVCIIISCMGTLNGYMLASVRGMYFIAVRNEGPNPKLFSNVDSATGMPTNSAIVGLIVCILWLVYFYGAKLAPESWFGPVVFDPSEITIITLYAMYIPIFVRMIKMEKDLNVFNRFIMPVLAIAGSTFMVIAAAISNGTKVVILYLIIFAVITVIGMLLKKPKNSNQIEEI